MQLCTCSSKSWRGQSPAGAQKPISRLEQSDDGNKEALSRAAPRSHSLASVFQRCRLFATPQGGQGERPRGLNERGCVGNILRECVLQPIFFFWGGGVGEGAIENMPRGPGRALSWLEPRLDTAGLRVPSLVRAHTRLNP
uniref:Uncharacterized protein n=1 Tax=Myotis myotis TaxID=51298 RepID=A0A7J7WVK3_MYOMY|nr:hypothetical protein mMyoMyo1_011861 [Myotis myotis]